MDAAVVEHVTVVDCYSEAADAAAAVDLDVLTDGELDAELVGLLRQRHRLDAQIARRVGRWDARSVWSSDGSRSPAARLARTAALSPPEAGRIVRRARRSRAMPAATEAWTAGEIGTDLVDLLAATGSGHRGDLFTRDEQVLLDECRGRRHAEAQRLCRYWQQRADAELDHDGTPPPPATNLRIGTGFDGCVNGDFTLDPIGGATVTEALRRIERDLYRQDQRTGRTRTLPERLAAALVEMAERANATPADAQRPTPLITVIVGEASLAHLCELATGTVIDPGLVVPHLSDADLQTFLFANPHRVLSASTQRTFRGTLRRAIQIRDRHCQHASGCDEPIAACDVDHIVPDAQGGPTTEANGRLLCEAHNRHADLDDRLLDLHAADDDEPDDGRGPPTDAHGPPDLTFGDLSVTCTARRRRPGAWLRPFLWAVVEEERELAAARELVRRWSDDDSS